MATLRSNCTMLAVMLEFAKRVAERSPPLNSTSTASALVMSITLLVIAFTSSREYILGVQGLGFRGSAVSVSVSRTARAVRAAGAAAALSRGGRRRAAGGRPHHSRAREPLDQVLALARRTRRRAPGVH